MNIQCYKVYWILCCTSQASSMTFQLLSSSINVFAFLSRALHHTANWKENRGKRKPGAFGNGRNPRENGMSGAILMGFAVSVCEYVKATLWCKLKWFPGLLSWHKYNNCVGWYIFELCTCIFVCVIYAL